MDTKETESQTAKAMEEAQEAAPEAKAKRLSRNVQEDQHELLAKRGKSTRKHGDPKRSPL